VSLLHSPSTLIQWVGVESYNGSPSTITSGASNTVGAHIVWIDSAYKVDIQVASADTIQIHNGDAATRAGNVTLIW